MLTIIAIKKTTEKDFPGMSTGLIELIVNSMLAFFCKQIIP